MQIYLSVTPQEVREASRYTRVFAHVAYRIGPESTLLRRELMDTRGGLMTLSDRDAPKILFPEKLAGAAVRECLRRGFAGISADFEDPPGEDRRLFLQTLFPLLVRNRRSLFLPEKYSSAVPGAITLVNTAVSGGNFQSRLRDAQAHCGGQAALDLQRLMMDFTLPEPSGEGTPLSREKLTQLMQETAPSVFFSPDLCARYFTYTRNGRTHFVLFDDADTLLRKIRIGTSLSYRAAFLEYPEVSDLLPSLFPK